MKAKKLLGFVILEISQLLEINVFTVLGAEETFLHSCNITEKSSRRKVQNRELHFKF